MFISDLDEGLECTMSKLADDSRQNGAGDTLEGPEALQRDLASLEHWTILTGMTFNNTKKCRKGVAAGQPCRKGSEGAG